MNKKIIFIFALIFCFFPFVNVYASTAELKVSKGNINVEDKYEIIVDVKNVAAWNVHIEATGATDSCLLDDADVTDDAQNTNKTFKVECQATEEGLINVKLTGDVTSNDEVTTILDSETSIVVSKKSSEVIITDEQSSENTNADTDKENNIEDNKSNPKTGTTLSILGISVLLAVSGYTYYYIKQRKKIL